MVIVVGIGITVRGATALDYLSILFGLALTFAPILGTPQLRFYLKVTVNYASRGKLFQLEQSNLQAENIINIQGDSASVQIGKKADYSPNELVERVYTPLLNEAATWFSPGTPHVGMPSGGSWSELQTKVPYLLKLVPLDIAEIFKQAKRLEGRISALALSMPPIIDKAIDAARVKLNLGQPGSGQVGFRIRFGNGALQLVWLGTLWASRKTLSQYATDFIVENYPGSDWFIDLVTDNQTIGDHKTALAFDEVGQGYLSQDPTAIEIRRKSAELKDLGVKARRRIDEEFDKLVRLKA